MQLLPALQLERQQPQMPFEPFVSHKLDAAKRERFIELLKIVDQKMSPGAIDALGLANDSVLEIKSALPPPEDLGYGRLAFERAKNRMTNRAVLKIDFAVSPARFESETTTPLTQTAHLQDFRSGKLIQVSDQRMAWIDPFRRRTRMRLK